MTQTAEAKTVETGNWHYYLIASVLLVIVIVLWYINRYQPVTVAVEKTVTEAVTKKVEEIVTGVSEHAKTGDNQTLLKTEDTPGALPTDPEPE